MSKLKICILIGAKSDEYASCLTSGKFVYDSLNREKYEVTTVRVSRDGEEWLFPKNPDTILPNDLEKADTASYETMSIGQAIDRLRSEKVDLVYLAAPGGTGEDGSFQGLMQAANLKYSHSGVMASALAMDKLRAAQMYSIYGLKSPKTHAVSRNDWGKIEAVKKTVAEKIGYPCFIKPNTNGSSIGAGMAKTPEDLEKILTEALKLSPTALVQELVKGREMTCAILDDGMNEPMPLTPTETIMLTGEFYTYEDKHVNEHSIDEFNPPENLSEEMAKEIQRTSLIAHKALGCSGLSRTDMLLTEKNELIVLETNTIPGTSAVGVYPKIMSRFGMDISDFFDRIIHAGLVREM